MLYVIKLASVLWFPATIICVTVEIDGVIDLGPKWNFAYSLKPRVVTPKSFEVKHFSPFPQNKEVDRQGKEHAAIDMAVTIMEADPIEVESFFNKPHTVRDDKQINEFAFHVYKQSLKVFDAIKRKVDHQIWPKVDFIARSYDDKFRAFVNETLNHNIKTKLGTQKVVLNTIDTSNRLMKRLVNYLLGEMNKEGVLRNQMSIANVFEKEVEKERALEYSHVCAKFKICRTARGFNNFMVQVFTIFVQCNEAKSKQALDAITEVLKGTDMKNIMSNPTHDKFLKRIEDAETWDPVMTRAMFMIMKNVFALKNQPLKVMTRGTEYIQSTVLLLEIVDEVDKALPPNEENYLVWSDITTTLNQWADGKRDDILEVMQSLVSHVMDSFNSMSKEKLENIQQKLLLMFN